MHGYNLVYTFIYITYRAHIPHTVGQDKYSQQDLYGVVERWAGFRHVDDDQRDEENVGEGGVDPPVERDLPLLAEPGRADPTSIGGGVYYTAVETGIEEEEEVTGNLLENMEESETLK